VFAVSRSAEEALLRLGATVEEKVWAQDGEERRASLSGVAPSGERFTLVLTGDGRQTRIHLKGEDDPDPGFRDALLKLLLGPAEAPPP
jgi:hypothetical protein